MSCGAAYLLLQLADLRERVVEALRGLVEAGLLACDNSLHTFAAAHGLACDLLSIGDTLREFVDAAFLPADGLRNAVEGRDILGPMRRESCYLVDFSFFQFSSAG